MVQAVRRSGRSNRRKKEKLHSEPLSGASEDVQPGEVSIRDSRDTTEEPIFFVKLSNGTDLLCRLLEEDDDFFIVTEALQFVYNIQPSAMRASISMMKWLPIDSLFKEAVVIPKQHIIAVITAPGDVAAQYLNSTSVRNADETKEDDAPSKVRDVNKGYLH